MRHSIVDLETESISEHERPESPPPVGLAIWSAGEKWPYYLSWGHPQGTNGVWSLRKGKLVDESKGFPMIENAARLILRNAFKGQVLGHNIAKFDLPVIEDHLGLKPPTWDKVDDTLFTLFLRDPHSSTLSLKPAAERDLGEAPQERDEVYDWLAEHGIIKKPTIEKGKVKYQKDAGAYICKAPGSLVARYAIGDLTRTKGLWDLHQPWVVEHSMQEAYDRERQLAPVLLDNERQGIRVDMEALERDIPICQAAMVRCEEWIRKRLKIKDKDYEEGFNFDSDPHVAQALRAAKVVTEFPLTPTGKDSVSKKRLKLKYFSDAKVYCAIHYRNTMATVLTQSMAKWYAEGGRKKGYIYREWNQVRQAHGEDNATKGARSGRVTVSGLANIAKRFGGKDPDYTHPAFLKVPEPPLARNYVLPDEGEEFGHADFDQQEMKIVAHYEDGGLARKYREDPKTDAHEFVHDTIVKISNKDYVRDVVKTVGFRKLYGGGISGLSEQLDIPYNEAAEIIHAWEAALPDVVDLDEALREKHKVGEYIRTLGGRIYYRKPDAVAKKGPRKGQLINFAYAALNYLVQPSAADQTKQAIIDYHNHPKRKARLLCQVYDELNISMPHERELKILEECMVNAFKLDVPVSVTLKKGPSWGKLAKLESPAKGKAA